MAAENSDPLKNPAFRGPGIFEGLMEAIFGVQRPLDCLQIEVTSFCAGRCVYCPHTSQNEKWKSRHISPETFTRLWPLLRLAKRAHLQGWGEPLLHPRFFDLAAFARKAGCQISTTSCGLKMDAEIAAKLAASGMDMIAFSLAGTDEQSNSAREGISLEKAASSIRLLANIIKDGSPEIHIAYILLADRMDAAARLPELMDDLNVGMTVVSTLDYLAVPEDKNLAFQPHEKEKIAQATHILRDAAERAARKGRVIHFALPGSKPVAHAGGCRENILRSLYVDADGNVSPCVYLNIPGADGGDKRRVFGNVHDLDPLAIWKREDFKAFRENLGRDNPDPACLNCPKRYEVEN